MSISKRATYQGSIVGEVLVQVRMPLNHPDYQNPSIADYAQSWERAVIQYAKSVVHVYLPDGLHVEVG